MDTIKCKLRFSFFDVFIVLLVFFSILWFCFRPKGTPCLAHYTLLITADAHYAEVLKEGRLLIDGKSKEACGVILSVSAEPYAYETRRGVRYDTEMRRFTVTVSANGYQKNGVFSIGSFAPAPGQVVFLHAPCYAEALCLSLKTEATV